MSGPEPVADRLRLYGRPSDAEDLAWSWVDEQLEAAATYWVVARTAEPPHPRPVWGVWSDAALHLSVGSPVLTRQLTADPIVTVHLESGTDVVVVEGSVTGPTTSAALVERYDHKYDWNYGIEEYGPLTSIHPVVVMAWRSAGWAGRDGFQATGRWRFGSGGG